MVSFIVFMFYAFISPEFTKVYLKNGQYLDLPDGFEIRSNALCFFDEKGTILSVPLTLVDFELTRRAAAFVPGKEAAEEDGPMREIPWELPQFRDKIATDRTIEISTKDVTEFSRDRKHQAHVGTGSARQNEPPNGAPHESPMMAVAEGNAATDTEPGASASGVRPPMP